MTLSLQIAAEQGDVPAAEQMQAWLDQALIAVGRQRADLTVRVVDQAESQALNCEYRGIDKATNVLAFPAGDIPGLPGDEEAPLGDLVICGSVVEREAAEQGKAVTSHWAHMLIHGTLHLLGYDHVNDELAEKMETLEKQVLLSCGFSDPYTDVDA